MTVPAADAPPAVPAPMGPVALAAFRSLAHAGSLPAQAGVGRGEAGREAVGTRVRFEVAVHGHRVTAVRFRAYGCPHTLAACEWLAQRLEGCESDKLLLGNPIDWMNNLEIPEYKLGRLLIVEDALRAALQLPPAEGVE